MPANTLLKVVIYRGAVFKKKKKKIPFFNYSIEQITYRSLWNLFQISSPLSVLKMPLSQTVAQYAGEKQHLRTRGCFFLSSGFPA